jgi:hypothetical protein
MRALRTREPKPAHSLPPCGREAAGATPPQVNTRRDPTALKSTPRALPSGLLLTNRTGMSPTPPSVGAHRTHADRRLAPHLRGFCQGDPLEPTTSLSSLSLNHPQQHIASTSKRQHQHQQQHQKQYQRQYHQLWAHQQMPTVQLALCCLGSTVRVAPAAGTNDVNGNQTVQGLV